MKKSSEGTTEIKSDAFWSVEPAILWNPQRLVEFVPTLAMTTNERLNAIARLMVYGGLLMMMYTGRPWGLYLPIFGLAVTLALYKVRGEAAQPRRFVPDETPKTTDPNPFIPSEQPECIPPTVNNPFMNVLLNEYVDNPTRPAACPYDEVEPEVESTFHYNLYQDLDGAIFGHNNSRREFYTMPSTTIPNQQGAFARWLYKVGGVCKHDQSACYRYHDLRANRGVVGDSEFLQ